MRDWVVWDGSMMHLVHRRHLLLGPWSLGPGLFVRIWFPEVTGISTCVTKLRATRRHKTETSFQSASE